MIVGALPEATITVREMVGARFEDESVTSYVTVYIPGVFVSTGLFVMILAVISPSSLSVAVAHEST